MFQISKLYHIQQQYMQILGQIEEAEGEITPEIDQALTFTKERLEAEGAEMGGVIKMIENWQDCVEAEINRLEGIRAKAVKSKELLKNRLLAAMQQFGVERIFTNTMTISLRSADSVEITDERLIPIDYQDPVPPKISKLRIKGDLKAGMDVPGAELVTKKHLLIK